MAESINAVRMSKKYRAFLPTGSKILNYAEKATGRQCDICLHWPEKRPAKQGYQFVSEEMRLMRVQLPVGTKASDLGVGKTDFTVTGDLVELNVCKDSSNCIARARVLKNEDGSLKYDDFILARFR